MSGLIVLYLLLATVNCMLCTVVVRNKHLNDAMFSSQYVSEIIKIVRQMLDSFEGL